MKISLRLLLICFLALLVRQGPSIAQTDTLATVYGVPITRDDFIKRWELAVYPGKDSRAKLDSTKMRFLYSLIAEQLLARAPVSIGTAADSNLETMRKESEETFMRDALFRQEVMNKVVITQRDLEEALRFSAYDYTVDAYAFPDSSSAVRFLKKVQGGDSTRFYGAVTAEGLAHDTLTVTFGDLQEDVERSFFGKSRGFISRPVRSKGAFAVTRILSRSRNRKYASMSLQDKFVSFKKKVLERRMDVDGWKYLLDVMHGIRVEVVPELFYALAREIQAILKTHGRNARVGGYHLTAEEFGDLGVRLSDRLQQPMVRFPDRSLTLQDAIASIPYGNFETKDTTFESVARSLHAALRFASQNYYLVERAQKLGLRDAPEVQSDVQMFVDAVRASDVATTIRNGVTVSPAERDSLFATRRDEILNDIKILVRFKTVRSVSEATDLLERFQASWQGKATPPLDTTKVSTRWVLGSEVGEHGAALARLSPGNVYGPIIGPRGYTVFQLLDKKAMVADSSLTQSLEAAEGKMLEEKRTAVVDQYVAKLAGEAGVRIYRAKVASTSVLPSQMYTMRYIGFGGRVNAVPMLPPRETWVRFVGRDVQIFP
jgi:hypothetical protein